MNRKARPRHTASCDVTPGRVTSLEDDNRSIATLVLFRSPYEGEDDSLEDLQTYMAEAALVLGVLRVLGVCGRPAGGHPGLRLGGLDGDGLLLKPAQHQPVPEVPEQEQQAESLENRSPRHLAGVRGQEGSRTSRPASLWFLHLDQDR